MKKAFLILCSFLMSIVALSGCAADNRDVTPAVPTPSPVMTPAPGFGADQGQMTPNPGVEIAPDQGGAGTGAMDNTGMLGGG